MPATQSNSNGGGSRCHKMHKSAIWVESVTGDP
ncbi:hypothetical protein AVEN_149760-1, partial [Araneus ventricosus]